MIKKILGTVAGGVMMFSGSASYAVVIDMSSQYTEDQWETYSYSGFSSGFTGNVVIGVANQSDSSSVGDGESIFKIDNVVPYDTYGTTGNVTVSGTSFSLSTDSAGGDCSGVNGFPTFIGLVGGSCSYVSFAVSSISAITFDWMMDLTDGFDFAFVAWNTGGDSDKLNSVKILTNPDAKPEPIPEPSSLALMALGLFGAGAIARRNQKKIA